VVSGELARTKLAVSLAAPLKLDKLLGGIGSAWVWAMGDKGDLWLTQRGKVGKHVDGLAGLRKSTKRTTNERPLGGRFVSCQAA
jgi:hypothetical protein